MTGTRAPGAPTVAIDDEEYAAEEAVAVLGPGF